MNLAAVVIVAGDLAGIIDAEEIAGRAAVRGDRVIVPPL